MVRPVVVLELDQPDQPLGLGDHFGPAADRAEQAGRHAHPLGHGEVDVLQHAQTVEQGVDLEGPHQPALDPLVLGQPGDVAAVEQTHCRWSAAGRRSAG